VPLMPISGVLILGFGLAKGLLRKKEYQKTAGRALVVGVRHADTSISLGGE
jgi:hypothetical protein